MEFIFNDYYFDKTADSLHLATFQASTDQLNIISIPFDDGSVIEFKTDIDNDPYWAASTADEVVAKAAPTADEVVAKASPRWTRQ